MYLKFFLVLALAKNGNVGFNFQLGKRSLYNRMTVGCIPNFTMGSLNSTLGGFVCGSLF